MKIKLRILTEVHKQKINVFFLIFLLQHYQNFQLLGAWCLLNSLYLILNLSPTALADKGKEKDPLAALRVRDIAARTKDGAGSPKLGPGKGYFRTKY